MLAELLGPGGHDVVIAFDGMSALRVATDFDPEIAFVDIGLPDLDGYEVARHLRKRRSRDTLRLVALTGYDFEDRARSSSAGFDHHLLKPVEVQAIFRCLSESVDRPRLSSPASEDGYGSASSGGR